jgi:hypothetical protein
LNPIPAVSALEMPDTEISQSLSPIISSSLIPLLALGGDGGGGYGDGSVIDHGPGQGAGQGSRFFAVLKSSVVRHFRPRIHIGTVPVAVRG